MRLLDLYCGEGGASTGYAEAGFRVTGVDAYPVKGKRYPYDFVLADAIEYLTEHGHEYDAIHASPPCKAHTPLKATSAREHPNLLTPTLAILRDKFQATPWIVENVPGAKALMPGALVLCGASFGLGALCADGPYRPLKRHRLFLSNIDLFGTPCACDGRQPIGVYGNGGGRSNQGRSQYQAPADEARVAIGAPWMSREGVSQSIPPAYTRFLGGQLMDAVK